jgi:ParB-like chromosome segregation protein Spo0J
MYDRMIRSHGYSIRKLAEKLGKDKGYVENRLRLADAPEEIRELVSCAQRHPLPRLRAAEGRTTRRSGGSWPLRSLPASCRS